MITNMYVIYDKVALEAGPVFEARNDGTALRNYSQVIEKNAADTSEFKLLFIGTMNHDTCKMEALDIPSEVMPNVDMEDEEDG